MRGWVGNSSDEGTVQLVLGGGGLIAVLVRTRAQLHWWCCRGAVIGMSEEGDVLQCW